jgi:iron complex outermembrane receptor protein
MHITSARKARVRLALICISIGVELMLCAEGQAQQTEAQLTDVSLSEIIVTAERRAEPLKDVPFSVTALSSSDLAAAGITSSQDLGMVTPGLQINPNGAYVQPSIRGISTSVSGSPTLEANVATYVDGVYQGTMIATIYALPDVQQIEVSKGPQGTLFGRNATGGAIQINTVQPDLNTATGVASATYGNFNDRVIKGYVTTPIISDELAFGITGSFERRNGYETNLVDGDKPGRLEDSLVRAKLRAVHWEGADFTLTAMYSKRIDYTILETSNYNGINIATALGVPASEIASAPWQFSSDLNPNLDSDEVSVSLRGSIKLGPGTLTSTTAYTRYTSQLVSDVDGSPLPIESVYFATFANSFQQELVYSADLLDHVHALGGLFFYHDYGGAQPSIVNNYEVAIYTRDRDRSYAAFADVVADLTDKFTVTGGVRYSDETETAYTDYVFGSPISPAPSAIPKLGEATWTDWTPRASLLYKLTSATNAYFTFSQGFKSGLFNTVSDQTTPVNPEKVNSYEVGFKSGEIRALSLNLAAFYYDYKDLQQLASTFNGAATELEVLNAANSKIYGAELSGTWHANKSFDVVAGLSYLHARYTSFPNAITYVPMPVGGNATVVQNLAGYTLIRSPTFTGNLTAHYVLPTSVGRFDAAANVYYSTKVYYDSLNYVTQPGYARLNAHVGWQIPNSGFEIRGWGNNLTNKAVLEGATTSSLADSVQYELPRTYGVDAIYRF